MWGFIIYEEQQELWGGKVYTRAVTCIGRTIVRNRRGLIRQICYLDIAGEAGDIQEQIETPNVIMESIRHGDTVLAVTNNPWKLYPLRIIPLHPPAQE